MNSVGQYAMVSMDKSLDFGGRKFRVVLYGAYNAMGLIGPEMNGIAVLDHDRKHVVLDGHCPEDSGYHGPSEAQKAEWNRICVMSAEEFVGFCNSHQRSRDPISLESKVKRSPKFNVAGFIKVASSSVAYNHEAKSEFLRTGKQMAIRLAAGLGLNEDQYDVRVNKAGIAVSGDVVLHTDTHYVCLSQSGSDRGFLVRSCKGRRDFTGGCNHFVKWESLRDLDRVCEFILSLA